jgi:hypothetical protein
VGTPERPKGETQGIDGESGDEIPREQTLMETPNLHRNDDESPEGAEKQAVECPAAVVECADLHAPLRRRGGAQSQMGRTQGRRSRRLVEESCEAGFDVETGDPAAFSTTRILVIPSVLSATAPHPRARQVSGPSDGNGLRRPPTSLATDELLFYFTARGVDISDFVDDDAKHILAALRALLALPAESRGPAELGRLLAARYDRDVPPEYIALVLKKVLALLRGGANTTLPPLLADASAALTFAVAPPELIFTRESSDDPDIHALECNLTFIHFQFERFTRTERMPIRFHEAAIVPNFKIITVVIRFSQMPAPQLQTQKNRLITFLKDFERDRLMLLLSGMGRRMKGVYRMVKEGVVEKIWGHGPHRIDESEVETFWKYATGTKKMEIVPTRHFTQTIDCICVKRRVEPRGW